MDEIKELQSLTTPKGVYNSFPDKTAREQLGRKLNNPGSLKSGDYLRVQSIGADGTVVLEGADQPGGGAGQNVALTTAQINALDGMFRVCAYDDSKDVAGAYAAFRIAFGIADEPGEEEPDTPEKTLTSISAVYSGGDVSVGTAVADLTGIVVTAHYSDGTSEAVTGYTLSGTIAEGSNTVTVSYGGKTATFSVTGVAESGGDDEQPEIPADATLLAGIISSGEQYIDTGMKITPYMGLKSVWDIPENPGSNVQLYGGVVSGANATNVNLYTGTQVYVGFCSQKTGQTVLDPSLYSQDDVTIRTGTAILLSNDVWYKPVAFEYAGKSITANAEWQAEPTADPINLYLFARNKDGAANGHVSATLKEFIIYSDEALTNEVMHLIHVKDSNGVVCMYDTVGKQYLYNSGTGDFVAVEVA